MKVGKHLCSVGLLLFTSLSGSVTGYAQPAAPAGTWVEVPNSRPMDAMHPAFTGRGAPGNPLSLFAYSGGTFGQVRGKWGFLLFGGGHAATPDNSLIFVPVDGSGPSRLTGPYIAPTGEYNYGDHNDGPWETYKPAGIYTAAPKSRHTYSGLAVGTKNGKPYLFMNGGSLHVGSGGGSGVLRMFDLTQTYDQAMARPDMGWEVVPSPAGSVSTQIGWDPVRKQLICRGRIYAAYFPDENRWDNLSKRLNLQAWGGGDVDGTSTVDVEGRWMYVIGGGYAERIHLDSYAWENLGGMVWANSGGGGGRGFTHAQNTVWGDTTGFVGGPGIDWHRRTKQIIAYVGDNRLLIFDPTKNVPAKVVAMSGVDTSGHSLIYGRFRVIPGTDQVVAALKVDANVVLATVPFDRAAVPARGAAPAQAPALTQAPAPAQPPAPTQAPAPPSTPAPAQPAAPAPVPNNADGVAITSPTAVNPGATFTASVTMKNTGTAPWTAAAEYRLGAQNPRDNSRWGMARVALPRDTPPGASVTFTATFTAPATPGTHPFEWQMVQERVAWFGQGVRVMIQVGAGSPAPAAGQAPAPAPAQATRPEGILDAVNFYSGIVSGWTLDGGRPTVSIPVIIVVDGVELGRVPSDAPSPDITKAFGVTGNHRFRFSLPDRLRDGKRHTLTVFALSSDGVTRVPLDGSSTLFALSPPGMLAPPPPPPIVRSPPGQPLPLRQWVKRDLPGPGPAPGGILIAEQGGLGSSKHTRTFYHPGLKSMVIAGGDRLVSMPRPEGTAGGTGSEVIALDVFNDKWKTLRKFCVPDEAQPGRPDTVVWALDRKRNRALMAPGFFFATQGTVSGCGAKEGVAGYAFDFTTNKWLGPDDPSIMVPAPPTQEFQGGGWGGDNTLSFGLVDNVGDELVLLKNGPGMERMNLETKKWRVMRLNAGGLNRAQPVIDEKGRAVYVLQQPNLLKIHLNRSGDYQQESIPLPPQFVMPAPHSASEWYLAFDPINRLVFVPNNQDMGGHIAGLGIYHVDTGKWEWESVPFEVLANLWGFDENVGALIGMGGEADNNGYYLYKYK